MLPSLQREGEKQTERPTEQQRELDVFKLWVTLTWGRTWGVPGRAAGRQPPPRKVTRMRSMSVQRPTVSMSTSRVPIHRATVCSRASLPGQPYCSSVEDNREVKLTNVILLGSCSVVFTGAKH